MTGPDSVPSGDVVAHAVIDSDGRLVEAEPALEALNRRAGGELGRPIAVPGLAALARLGHRLGIAISRSLIVADDGGDVELWVRVRPEGNAVRLSASGWRERPGWPKPTGALAGGAGTADADWLWESDAALRLTRLAIQTGPQSRMDTPIGQPVAALFDLGSNTSMLDALTRCEPFESVPATLRAGRERVLLSATVRRGSTGRFAGFLGTARRVEPASDAHEPARAVPAFAAGLDRVLRRPLAQIVANAESIHAESDGPVGSDYAGYAADIAQAGRHLMALIDDLVDLQAVERPDFMPAVDRIDLADVAGRAAGLLGVRAAQAGVAIERPLAGTRLSASGDFRRTLQILVNLLGNALRYAPRGSIVLIAPEQGEGRVAISIVDEGKGIASADQARVFEKFERVDASEPGGSGLGLYIARRLARSMGGDLTLASAPEEGARFTLSLPAAPDA